MIAALKARIQSKITNDKHFAELIKGSGIAFVLKIVGVISGYIFTFLVTRTFGAEAWGNFSLSIVVLQIASVIGKFGMDTAILRFTAEYTAKGEISALKEIYKKVLALVVPFSILVMILVYLLSPILADKLFHKPYLTDYFWIVSFITVPFVLLCVVSESIRGLKKIKEYMLLKLIGSILSIVFFSIGLLITKSLFLPIVSYSLSTLVILIISAYLWKKYISKLSNNSSSNSSHCLLSYRDILSVSIPLLLSGSLSLVMGWTDTIMLGIFRSAQEVGVYNVALRLSMITSIILMAVNTIAAPKFAEFFGRNDFQSLKHVAQQSTKLIFWLSIPIVVSYFLFPECFMELFGEEFRGGALVLIILSAGQFVNALTGSVGLILMMTGKHIIHRNIMLITATGNFFLNIILINKFGAVGAALATALTQSFANLAAMFLVRIHYGFYTITGIWR